MRQLGQLIMINGFDTDARNAGVEALTVTKPRKELGMVSEYDLRVDDVLNSEETSGLDELLPPHGIAFCKGWTRSITFNTIMYMAYENEDFLQAEIYFLLDFSRVLFNVIVNV